MTDDSGSQGLSTEEAAARLLRDGPNRLALQPSRGLREIAAGVVVQPMFLLLLATALVYALVGSVGDAAALLLSVAAVGGISLVQEYRTERMLASLKELSSPRARVVRGGLVVHVPSQDLVAGDRLLVAEGDRLACDALLLQAHGLTLDESLLSGESAPVLKAAIAPGRAPAEATDAHRLHAGTLVVGGDGVARVVATGAATALGRIGGALAGIERRPSRVQAELKRVVARVAVFAALVSLGAAMLYALRQGSWVEGLLAGLTLAMAIIPEEFAVVWTVMLALGAWRLARLGVLTRQAQAVEALGTTTVLCVDKTGTLTCNRMELVALAAPRHATRIEPDGSADERFTELLQTAARACIENGIEPMDRAVLRLVERSGSVRATPGTLLHREGVAPDRPWFTQWWQRPGQGGSEVAIKGAPESVLAMCGLDPARHAQIAADAQRLAQQGLRVLGVARAPGTSADPAAASPTPKPEWMGLLGFLDPVRDDVPAAMAQCRAAGIRVVMITGDAPATALAIAGMAGLDTTAATVAVTGPDVAALSDSELEAAAQHTTIYARVSPDQKLRIVRALQRHGHVVAMTGDGVNDASALRAADIGVAMGQRGTDVAREAAALVLLQDSFVALVDAVRMGRRIFGNLRNAVGYLIAVHVPIVGVSLLPVLLGGPVLLLPLHVVLMELLIDPACSLVFEAEPEPLDSMQQPPRPAHVRLLSASAARRAATVGVLAFALSAATLALGQWAGLDLAWMRLTALLSLISGNLLMLVWYLRGAGLHGARRRNRALQWLLVGVCAALALIALLPSAVPQLGLPVNAVLQTLGALLGVFAMGATVVMQRRWRGTAARPPGSPQRSAR